MFIRLIMTLFFKKETYHYDIFYVVIYIYIKYIYIPSANIIKLQDCRNIMTMQV